MIICNSASVFTWNKWQDKKTQRDIYSPTFFSVNYFRSLLGGGKTEHNSKESTKPLQVHQGVLGVGGLGGLYPAVRHYATCHHNGSIYEHGEAVSP